MIMFSCHAYGKKLFTQDERSKELKYKYEVWKADEKDKKDSKVLNLRPSGYMTVDEYEKMSEYKDKSNIDFNIPKIQTPSDFKYVPQPLYSIVKYNDPAGSPELRLGKKLYSVKQINAQGIVAPDYTFLVYPAVYYYSDSASVASDLFTVPLDEGDTNLNKILKANVIKRNPDPILSTDKVIDNYAAFRSLTPVDFNPDGTKLLVKEKIGSSEDGIWETRAYIYDFVNKTDYDLKAVRDAIVYFWKEYMEVDLDDARWDIYPLGFDKKDPNQVVVQGFAFTGEKPIFLGSWSIDTKGEQSRLISFDKDYLPEVSINGYKVIKDGVESYAAIENQEKFLKKETKYIVKQKEKEQKETIKLIEDEYKLKIRELNDEYKDERRDLKKLRSMTGSVEDAELQAAYKQYLIDQTNKDIQKTQKKIDKQQKHIDKLDTELDKLYQDAGMTSKTQDSNGQTSAPESEAESDSNPESAAE